MDVSAAAYCYAILKVSDFKDILGDKYLELTLKGTINFIEHKLGLKIVENEWSHLSDSEEDVERKNCQIGADGRCYSCVKDLVTKDEEIYVVIKKLRYYNHKKYGQTGPFYLISDGIKELMEALNLKEIPNIYMNLFVKK